MGETLVLGAGGVAGIAWITGLLAGLADNGQDVTGADLIVGTSAGSTVAAQLGSGLGLEELYVRQIDPALQAAEISAEAPFSASADRNGDRSNGDRRNGDGGNGADRNGDGGTGDGREKEKRERRGSASPAEVRRAVGRAALAAETVAEPLRRAVIESRLPSHTWPDRALRVVAVDTENGEPRVFDRDSGVSLVDAVTASCAVPTVWPPATVDGRRYMDGGVRSIANADFAKGSSRVLVIVPLGREELFPSDVPLARTVEELRAGGAEVAVVEPDEASLEAIGTNPLDPSTRGPAAEAGRAQGRSLTLEWVR